jgi:ubiquinone/menaquinone biosynthesis C-methylase UbiE
MNLSEAEIQVLATLQGAELETQPTDRVSLEKGGERYWIFLEDWPNAFSSLADKGLIDGDEAGYRLTEVGRPLAHAYYQERPDYYWYYFQRFYSAAHASEAHTRFCERVYGKDLCQEGQTDMAALGDLLAHLDLKPGDHLLDLGCGAGGISEYVSDHTGAQVTGIDYSVSAIATANTRTEDKRSRLTFLQADLNTLELPAQSFDAAISLDSIYWVADFAEALMRIVRTLKPGGQIGILIVHILAYCDRPEELEIDNTPVASALSELDLDYQAHDCTAQFREFWPRVKEAAVALREDFENEGNGFISQNWIREADDEYMPAIKANEIRRYLYHVRL